MNEKQMKEEIIKLAKERDALILAHNYQRDEIQDIADITGDSLALSIAASETDKKVIVFCGVHFMAESAAVLAPDKTVLLPVEGAGCPMADMVTPEALQVMRDKYPGVPVVAYVNTSAATKALSDISCTSANSSHKKFIIATERGILCQLRKENPDKEFFFPDYEFICKDMKLITLEALLICLQNMAPQITVPDEVSVAARRSLERMLAVPRD